MLSYQQAIKELAQREWEDMNFMSADEFWDSTCGRHYYIAQKDEIAIIYTPDFNREKVRDDVSHELKRLHHESLKN